jgi:hypothetical protein
MVADISYTAFMAGGELVKLVAAICKFRTVEKMAEYCAKSGGQLPSGAKEEIETMFKNCKVKITASRCLLPQIANMISIYPHLSSFTTHRSRSSISGESRSSATLAKAQRRYDTSSHLSISHHTSSHLFTSLHTAPHRTSSHLITPLYATPHHTTLHHTASKHTSSHLITHLPTSLPAYSPTSSTFHAT